MLESQPSNNPAPGLSSLRGAFVGRQQEMGELKAVLDDAMAGQGRLVMLVGEPGIGKTRTAQELASYAETRGTQVLWGRCYEEEGAPPYWPWLQLLRSYVQQQTSEQLLAEMGAGAADIAEIVPEIRHQLTGLETPTSLEPEQARFRLFDSITTFLKNAAQSQPLMLVLDDLHWADKPSLLLLQFLAREMGGSRLLVVGTYRDVELSRQHPLSETLAQLSREPVFRRELLRGLSREDTGDFVEVAVGLRPPHGLVENIHLQTEGNPFFMGEVIRLLAEQGELREGKIGESPSIRIPEGVREVIGQRLNRLSGQCNQTLVTAAVIGRGFDFRLLIALSDGVSESQLLEAIDEGLEAHLIEELPGWVERYQFTHALIQETLSEELSTSRRVRLHARIAQALEEFYVESGEDHAAELAHHFAEAETVLGTEKLVQYSRLAGEQALASFAPEEALTHFERALTPKKGQPMDAETAALLFGLGRAQVAALPRSQMHDAIDTLARAFEYYESSGDVERAVAVAEIPIVGFGFGHRTGLGQIIERALALVPPESHQAGRLFSRYGRVLGMEDGNYDGAQDAFGKAISIAQREGDTTLEMRTLPTAANIDSFHLHPEEALWKSCRAIELAIPIDDLFTEVPARFQASRALMILGDREGFRSQAEKMLAAGERLRDNYWLVSALWRSEQHAQFLGNWDAARAFSDRALGISAADHRLLPTRVVLEYQSGEYANGSAYLERLIEVTRSSPPQATTGFGLTAVAIPAVARITGTLNNLEIAEFAIDTILSSPAAPPLVVFHAKTGQALLAIHHGDQTTSEEVYEYFNALLGRVRIWVMTTERLMGLLSITLEENEQANTHFENSLLLCREQGLNPELAWTCCDYADCLLQRNEPGDREKAMSLLDEALAISTELGMRPLMKRVTERVERIQAQPLPALAFPDGLTHREVEVLRLIASGKTNRQIGQELFISPNTVGHHVSNILSKTGTANRAEVAAYAARQGLVSL